MLLKFMEAFGLPIAIVFGGFIIWIMAVYINDVLHPKKRSIWAVTGNLYVGLIIVCLIFVVSGLAFSKYVPSVVCLIASLVFIISPFVSLMLCRPIVLKNEEQYKTELKAAHEKREAAEKVEREKQQAIEQAEREKWQPIRESAIEAVEAIGYDTRKKFPNVTAVYAVAILNVMTTEPMTAKEINAALGEEVEENIFSNAIRYIEQAMPIEKSKKVEETVIMKGGWPMKVQYPVTAYALYEDIKGAIFTYISTKPNESFTIDDIDLMDGKQFEEYIAKLFTKMGYKAEVTKASNDQGIDVIAKKDGTSIGIQAKRYSGTVGNSAVQEAVGGKALYKVDKIMVITNNEFTSGAKKLAQANDVVLWDRTILKDKVRQYAI